MKPINLPNYNGTRSEAPVSTINEALGNPHGVQISAKAARRMLATGMFHQTAKGGAK
jgi:hypothetical protein